MRVWYFLVHSELTQVDRIVREVGVTSLAAMRLARASKKLMPRDRVVSWVDDVSLHLGTTRVVS